MLHATAMGLGSLAAFLLLLFAVYLVVRLGSAAFFASKLEYEFRKGSRNGVPLQAS